ncbi:MAG: hypothetical protein P1V18_02600 [Candidatus Gracilibacteria bacterium]|nr:hypothetical protein [Candidatus Gracilibacteria bacterium]
MYSIKLTSTEDSHHSANFIADELFVKPTLPTIPGKIVGSSVLRGERHGDIAESQLVEFASVKYEDGSSTIIVVIATTRPKIIQKLFSNSHLIREDVPEDLRNKVLPYFDEKIHFMALSHVQPSIDIIDEQVIKLIACQREEFAALLDRYSVFRIICKDKYADMIITNEKDISPYNGRIIRSDNGILLPTQNIHFLGMIDKQKTRITSRGEYGENNLLIATNNYSDFIGAFGKYTGFEEVEEEGLGSVIRDHVELPRRSKLFILWKADVVSGFVTRKRYDLKIAKENKKMFDSFDWKVL